jgi:dihydroneopterin aldolase
MAPDDGRTHGPDDRRRGAPGGAAAAAPDDLYVVRLRGLVVDFRIGIHPHELDAAQRVRIDVTVDVARPEGGFNEDYRRVYCYERLAKGIRTLAGGGHVGLVETLADRIAELALGDPRAHRAEVSVEKLDVFPDAEAAGVTVVHRRKA